MGKSKETDGTSPAGPDFSEGTESRLDQVAEFPGAGSDDEGPDTTKRGD